MPTKLVVTLLIGMIAASGAFAQDAPRPTGSIDGTNLPVQKIGKEDLLGITVYDSPELTHTYRVLPDGHVRLPMLKTMIVVEGLYPADVEILIADALK